MNVRRPKINYDLLSGPLQIKSNNSDASPFLLLRIFPEDVQLSIFGSPLVVKMPDCFNGKNTNSVTVSKNVRNKIWTLMSTENSLKVYYNGQLVIDSEGMQASSCSKYSVKTDNIVRSDFLDTETDYYRLHAGV